MWLFTNGHYDLISINKKYINELYKNLWRIHFDILQI